MKWKSYIGGSLELATRNVIGAPDAFRQFMKRKMIKPLAHVPARIAVLQPPDKNLIQSRPRNNPQMPELGHCPRQLPTGDARTHTALNNGRIVAHVMICLIPGGI